MPVFQKGIQLYLVHSFLCGFAQSLLYFNSIQEGLNSTRNHVHPQLNPSSYQFSICNVRTFHFSFQSCLEINLHGLLLYFKHFHFQMVEVYALNWKLDLSCWYHLKREQNCTTPLSYFFVSPFSAFFCMHLWADELQLQWALAFHFCLSETRCIKWSLFS